MNFNSFSLLSALAEPDLLQELIEFQENSPNGIIYLDDTSFKKFAVLPQTRPYSLVILFDAIEQLKHKQQSSLGYFRREYEILAKSNVNYLKTANKTAQKKIFFCNLDLMHGRAAFALLSINFAPHVRYVGPGNADVKDSHVMRLTAVTKTAEGMKDFVEGKTGEELGSIIYPPLLTKKQAVLLTVVLVMISPFVIRAVWRNRSLLFHAKVWSSMAVFVYFFSVSGGMHNIIRGAPMFLRDINDPEKLVFFHQGSGTQIGAEGFAVGDARVILGCEGGHIS
eukprot:Gb_01497 [translate_table: standard]